jgi:tetratricopeptide (TPR) repeat protein
LCYIPSAVAAKEDKKNTKDSAKDPAKPNFDPKPVQLGGESLIERLLPYMKQIAYVLVGIAIIVSIVFTVRHFKERDREKSTTKLVKVLDIADHEVKDPNEPDLGDPKKAKEPTFASQKARAEAVLAALGTGNEATTAYKASMLMQAGKLDEAIAEYKKGENAKGLDGVLSREGLGIALETKALDEKDPTARQKGLEDALAVFQTMQPDEKGPRAAYAFYHQGRLLAQLQRAAEARTALEKAKELGAGTELPSLIDERLAMLGGS